MLGMPVRSGLGISVDDGQPGWSDSDQSGISGTGFAVRNLHSSLLLAALKPPRNREVGIMFSIIAKRVSESQVHGRGRHT